MYVLYDPFYMLGGWGEVATASSLSELAALPALKRAVTFYGPFSFPVVILILHSIYVPFLGY